MSQQPPLGRELMLKVRAQFLMQDTTLTQWCRENNLHISAARQALYGTWDGPKARVMRAKILKAAHIKAAA